MSHETGFVLLFILSEPP